MTATTDNIDAPRSRYVCGDHLDQAVTWKGTGCVVCERELARRRRKSRDAVAPNRNADGGDALLFPWSAP